MNIALSTKDEILPLFRAYMIYMSQFFEIEDEEQWFSGAMSYLDRYGSDQDRHIYVLKDSTFLIGFAMVNTHNRFNSEGYVMSEFYIDSGHQRSGYGRQLAENVLNRFPGEWEVAVTRGNARALHFWREIVADHTGGKYREWEIDSYEGSGFSFKVG